MAAVGDTAQHLLPAHIQVSTVYRDCDELQPGTLRVAVEFPTGNTPKKPQLGLIDGTAHGNWNDGDRSFDTTRELYPNGLVEPYVDWFGNLAWRATELGKKADLK
jgi:hypothetical protein